MHTLPPSTRSGPTRPATLLAALTVCALLASACSAPLPAPPTIAPTPDQPAELSVYMPQVKTLTQMLDAMVQATPDGARVKLTILDQSYNADQQLPELNKKDQPPDLVLTYSPYYTKILVDAGLLLDLREQMNPDAQFNLDNIDERALDLGRVKGHGGSYALPFMADNVQLYYNKTLLQQAKVALPAPDWTWDDLITQCQRLQAARQSVICLGLEYATSSGYWYPWVRGYGGDVLSPDGTRSTLSSPETLEGLQRYQELWTKHKVMSPVQFPSLVDCFIGQRCAIILANATTSRTVAEQVGSTFEWDTQLLPLYPRGRYSTGGVLGFGVGVASKHPSAAWALLRSLASPEAQGALLTGSYGLPVLKTLPTVAGRQVPPYLQPFLDGRASSLTFPVYPRAQACENARESRIGTAIDEAFSAVFYRKGNFAQVLPQADKTIQQCLDAARASP